MIAEKPQSPVTPSEENEERARGLVVRTTGKWNDVRIGDRTISSRLPGSFRLTHVGSTNPLAVGDVVDVDLLKDGTGAIRHIHERTNKLSRRAPGRRSDREHVIAANIDHVWVIQSVKRPRFNNGFVDRLIVIAESEHIPVGLVINKVDLIASDDAERTIAEWKSLYQRLEYPVLLTSATENIGIEDFKSVVTDRVSLVFGPSGAGKSSLLNAMAPELELPVGDVSDKTRKGRHTTSYARLWQIGAGYVIDTPGIRELGLWEFQPSDLSGFFAEMQPLRDDCKFPNCVHDHEPGCAIRVAVEQGMIHQERYASYLRILSSLSDED